MSQDEACPCAATEPAGINPCNLFPLLSPLYIKSHQFHNHMLWLTRPLFYLLVMAKEKKKNIKHRAFPSRADKGSQESQAVCGMSFEKN